MSMSEPNAESYPADKSKITPQAGSAFPPQTARLGKVMTMIRVMISHALLFYRDK